MNTPFPPIVTGLQYPKSVFLDALEEQDPNLFAVWGEHIKLGWSVPVLGSRPRQVVIVTLESLLRRPKAFIDYQVNEAFNAGSNVAELLEALVHTQVLHGGLHSVHDGLESVERIVQSREKIGLPAPYSGLPLTESERNAEPPFVIKGIKPTGPIFPYMQPSPRLYFQAWKKYDPNLFEAFIEFFSKKGELRKGLSTKTEEFVVVAIDAAILWPEPLIDHHLHAAFDAGATVQEQVEVILIACEYTGGDVKVIRYGLQALDRVIKQRIDAGILT